ncbi:unnamed protein product [Peniophora sp. CBMAI 1063]|nr:unnamed protein product [Peniophora sp. CBMAI 1063]
MDSETTKRGPGRPKNTTTNTEAWMIQNSSEYNSARKSNASQSAITAIVQRYSVRFIAHWGWEHPLRALHPLSSQPTDEEVNAVASEVLGTESTGSQGVGQEGRRKVSRDDTVKKEILKVWRTNYDNVHGSGKVSKSSKSNVDLASIMKHLSPKPKQRQAYIVWATQLQSRHELETAVDQRHLSATQMAVQSGLQQPPRGASWNIVAAEWYRICSEDEKERTRKQVQLMYEQEVAEWEAQITTAPRTPAEAIENMSKLTPLLEEIARLVAEATSGIAVTFVAGPQDATLLTEAVCKIPGQPELLYSMANPSGCELFRREIAIQARIQNDNKWNSLPRPQHDHQSSSIDAPEILMAATTTPPLIPLHTRPQSDATSSLTQAWPEPGVDEDTMMTYGFEEMSATNGRTIGGASQKDRRNNVVSSIDPAEPSMAAAVAPPLVPTHTQLQVDGTRFASHMWPRPNVGEDNMMTYGFEEMSAMNGRTIGEASKGDRRDDVLSSIDATERSMAAIALPPLVPLHTRPQSNATRSLTQAWPEPGVDEDTMMTYGFEEMSATNGRTIGGASQKDRRNDVVSSIDAAEPSMAAAVAPPLVPVHTRPQAGGKRVARSSSCTRDDSLVACGSGENGPTESEYTTKSGSALSNTSGWDLWSISGSRVSTLPRRQLFQFDSASLHTLDTIGEESPDQLRIGDSQLASFVQDNGMLLLQDLRHDEPTPSIAQEQHHSTRRQPMPFIATARTEDVRTADWRKSLNAMAHNAEPMTPGTALISSNEESSRPTPIVLLAPTSVFAFGVMTREPESQEEACSDFSSNLTRAIASISGTKAWFTELGMDRWIRSATSKLEGSGLNDSLVRRLIMDYVKFEGSRMRELPLEMRKWMGQTEALPRYMAEVPPRQVSKRTAMRWHSRSLREKARTPTSLDHDIAVTLPRQWALLQPQARLDARGRICIPASLEMDWREMLAPGIDGVRVLIVTVLQWAANIQGDDEQKEWEQLATDICHVLGILIRQAPGSKSPSAPGIETHGRPEPSESAKPKRTRVKTAKVIEMESRS